MNDEEQSFRTIKTNIKKTLQPANNERTIGILEQTVCNIHDTTKHAHKFLNFFYFPSMNHICLCRNWI